MAIIKPIVIRCPVRDVDVPTGLAFDRATFDALRLGTATMRCPACGGRHDWTKADARWGSGS